MLDFLQCIRSFVAVAECHGFSPAARQLQISTPALTKQIQALEEHLGKKLLERTTRYVAITEAGGIYLEHAKRILADVEIAANSVNNIETEPHGNLRIGIPGVFETLAFLKHLQLFLNRYPKITVDIRNDNSPTLILDDELDLTVSEHNLHDKKLIKEHLFTVRRSVYAAPSYLKKQGTPKTIADLKNHNCLIYKRVTPTNQWIFGNNKKVNVSGNYTSMSGMNLLFALTAGMGLIWGSDLVMAADIKKGKVVEVPLDYPPFESKAYLYYRPTNMNQPLKLMIEHLKLFTKDCRRY